MMDLDPPTREVPMPRLARARPPAEPTSLEQQDRQRRILRDAGRLAAEQGLERVGMQEVARESGVAIATLYRYFPSKTHLFTSVMADQVDRLATQASVPPEQDRLEAVADLLAQAGRQLLSRPLLAKAMILSTNAAHGETVLDAVRIDETFRELLLRLLRIKEPTAHDLTLLRLLAQCWYGGLTQALNGRTTAEDVEADIRVACRLLLAECSGG